MGVCVVDAAYLSQVHFSRAAGRALGRAGVVPQGCLHSTSALPVAGEFEAGAGRYQPSHQLSLFL